MRFLLRLVVTACALWIAVRFVPGIGWTGNPVGLLGVAVVFGLLNALVRQYNVPLEMVGTVLSFLFLIGAVIATFGPETKGTTLAA